MAQQQVVHKFVLGNKELEGKVAEFQYDKGWYSITDIVGEERNVIYKSRNAQEAARQIRRKTNREIAHSERIMKPETAVRMKIMVDMIITEDAGEITGETVRCRNRNKRKHRLQS